MHLRQFAVFLLLQIYFPKNCSSQNMKVILEWAELEFIFPSQEIEENATKTGQYISGNAILIDVDVQYKNTEGPRVFVTAPRFKDGVPASLSTVSNISGKYGPKLLPYPDYWWHSSQGADCNGMTSVFRVAIDICNRLWVLDSGNINEILYCNPQLLTFNLTTDDLIHRYVFPENLFKPNVSLFINPIVNVRGGDCEDTIVYIADSLGFELLVYSLREDSAFRIENEIFLPEDKYKQFSVAGVNFTLPGGIFGLAITPENLTDSQGQTERFFYVHAITSVSEHRIPLELVSNRGFWNYSNEWDPNLFQKIGVRPSQSAVEVMDSNGNLYFGLFEEISIASWNYKTPYDDAHFKIVAQNDTTLQVPFGMKVIRNIENEEELWVATDRFQKFATGTLTNTEINFRVLRCTTDELQRGKGC